MARLALNIVYGANYSIAKISLPQYIQPAGYILLRVAGSTLLYALFLLLFMRGKSFRIDKSDWLRFILCGITGVALNQVLFFEGLARTSPVHAALILTSNPLLVLVADAVPRSGKKTYRQR